MKYPPSSSPTDTSDVSRTPDAASPFEPPLAASSSQPPFVSHDAPAQAAATEASTARPAWRSLATWGSIGVLSLLKFKSVLGLVKLLPMGKVLLTSLSMLAMIAFESYRSGWTFGVGFVLLILIHELGHGYAMRRHGVHAGWPVFIPFFGAMIAMKGTPRDRDVEAHIAYGGPLAGAAASLATAGVALAMESRLLLAIAYSGFFLNLFNLTPMSPLDGGRIAQAFSRRAWIAGLVILGGMLILTQAPQLLLIGILGLSQLFRRDSERDREVLGPTVQRAWALRYFGLCSVLVGGVYFTGRLLGH